MSVSHIVLFQEELHVAHEPTEITTVLGSCVAVCLWDHIVKIAGMNHYLLPRWPGKGQPSLKYGDVSIRKLLDEMILKGALKQNIVAKIFGGASINFGSSLSVGEKNIEVAESVLCDLNIPIIARDIGGTVGRKVIISSVDGSVYVKTADKGLENG